SALAANSDEQDRLPALHQTTESAQSALEAERATLNANWEQHAKSEASLRQRSLELDAAKQAMDAERLARAEQKKKTAQQQADLGAQQAQLDSAQAQIEEIRAVLRVKQSELAAETTA